MKVDLEAIIQLRGSNYSLIDQKGPCRVWQCDGKAFFIWSPGQGVPLRPLQSQRGIDARMFGRETPKVSRDDHNPIAPQPPRPSTMSAPPGIDPEVWQRADERERKRLARVARG